MTVPVYSTGAVHLPDTGACSYNGISFGLYRSRVNGTVVQDEARRTTRYMEWRLEVSGVVTLTPKQSNTDQNWVAIRRQLSVHGGALIYKGNGFGGLNVNVKGGPVWDVAWGPVPEVITFIPLGQGRSAFIEWAVTTRIPELPPSSTLTPGIVSPGGLLAFAGAGSGRVAVQFNYECGLTYDEDGYSGLSIRGTLEVPMTRTAVQARALTATVDDLRNVWLSIAVDLTKFRVTNRSFDYSRDKRTVEFSFAAEELAPMGLPVGATNARGTMSVRPFRLGQQNQAFPTLTSTTMWAATLRATYTITKTFPARLAAEAFWALWWYRMNFATLGKLPLPGSTDNAGQQPSQAKQVGILSAAGAGFLAFGFTGAALAALGAKGSISFYESLNSAAQPQAPPVKKSTAAIPLEFSFDEGLYLDSKLITFQASWLVMSAFRNILDATGVWRWLPDTGGLLWAASVQGIMGSQSWLKNGLDPNADVIVDLGGGNPPQAPPFNYGPGGALPGFPTGV